MKDKEIAITLVDLGEVEGASAINRRALRRLTREAISVDMNVKVVPDVDRSLLSVIVSCFYRAVIGFIRERLLVCTAVATFEVDDLAALIKENGEEKIVPASAMMNMLGIAVGALRGIVAVKTAATPLRRRPMPIIDLHTLMRRLSS